MPRRAGAPEDFDPNLSDPNDETFDVRAFNTPHRSHKRKSEKIDRGGKTPTKKRQRTGGYVTSESDAIVRDDAEEFDSEEWSQQESEQEIERDPITGRPRRNITHKNLRESSDEEEEFVDNSADDEGEDDEEQKPQHSPVKSRRARPDLAALAAAPSKVVTLAFSLWDQVKGLDIKMPPKRTTRNRGSRSRTATAPPVSSRPPTRKSSRLSQEPEPLVALSSSGKHVVPASKSGSPDSDDEILVTRKTRGGKAPAKKMPSTVVEESQEHSNDAGEAQEDTDADEHAHGHDVVDSVEFEQEQAGVPDTDAIQPEEGAADDAEGEDDEVVGVPQLQSSDEDDAPVRRSGRQLRSQQQVASRRSSTKRKRGDDESSEFAPDEDAPAEDENISEPEGPRRSKRARVGSKSDSDSQKSKGRQTRNSQRSRQQSSEAEDSDDLDPDELQEEADNLRRHSTRRRTTRRSNAFEVEGMTYESDGRTRRNAGKRPDYTMKPLSAILAEDEQAAAAQSDEDTQARSRGKKRKTYKARRLHSVRGLFGGFTEPPAVLQSELDDIAMIGADSDSDSDSDMDELQVAQQQLKTPAAHDAAGGPADFGKVNKEKKAVAADSDPLGVDESVKFDAVGGLDDHINALKEMVLHPLMYPEVISKFGVQPPRGVLFHGPPGTGKTLLARALSNSIESEGKKVTFFMRKGADALSKWVGEAERQLRLLFEEAQKCQPSIIFFDEIDGLAPTRSSKTEQIHASIVATLLALMDGMDNRGQVVVIGATNRPDNVDPALRRPGRFDREFYFPLPDKKARQSIININTKSWEPPLKPQFVEQLSELTVGYGGADLRALCTEAAMAAIQGTYPQIYSSERKLLVDPQKIKVLAKDFMLSVNKIVPSSARSNTSKVEPLSKAIEPLLRKPLAQLVKAIDEILPRRPKLTALQEAEFDDRDDEGGFERETLQREVDRAVVFRPRLLVRGLRGLGQQELASAVLHKLEGLFVQSFDTATLMEDTGRSPEAAVVQLFKEIRRQTPSVIFIPDIDIWYDTVPDTTLRIFKQQLASIPANDKVLLLGFMSTDAVDEKPNPQMMRDFFINTTRRKGNFELERPDKEARFEYFSSLVTLMKKRPIEFPDPSNRKRRKIEALPEVKPTQAQQDATAKARNKQEQKDYRYALNTMKMQIANVFDQIKKKYGIFRNAQIPVGAYKYLFDDTDENALTSDLPEEQRQVHEHRPYVMDKDRRGRGVLREVATGKIFYNMDIEDVEERLHNGYYRRYRDFIADMKTILHDAQQIDITTAEDPIKARDRRSRAQELMNNLEVDWHSFEQGHAQIDRVTNQMFVKLVKEYREKRALGPSGHPIGTTTNRAPIINAPTAPNGNGRMPPPPFTPVRNPHGNAHTNGDSANGSAPLTNGSTVPSRHTNGTGDGDIIMTDVAAPVIPAVDHRVIPPPILRQTTALEKMAPGSQVDDYRNSGSTTETNSGKKSGPAQQAVHTGSISAHTPAGFPIGYMPAIHPKAAAVGAPGSMTGPGAAAPQGVVPSQGSVAAHGGVVPAAAAGVTSQVTQMVDSQGNPVSMHQPVYLLDSRGDVLLDSHGNPMLDSMDPNNSRYFPPFESVGDLEGGSQIPDTQPNSHNTRHSDSTENSARKAAAANALRMKQGTVHTHPPNMGVADILNKPTPPPPTALAMPPPAPLIATGSSPTEPHPTFYLREEEILALHSEIAEGTSGFTVEQLVQVMAELVGEVVRSRGEWDKGVVVERVRAVFEEVRGDVREGLQVLMEASRGEE